MASILSALRTNRRGAGSTEYALLLGLIGLAIIAGGSKVGIAVNDRLSAAATRLSNGS